MVSFSRYIKEIVILLSLVLGFFVFRALTSNDKTVEMVLVEGGEFTMGDKKGDADRKFEHKVNLNSFYISKYEITNLQYCEFLNKVGNKSVKGIKYIDWQDKHSKIRKIDGTFYPKPGYKNHPVLEVSWYGANAFCEWKGGRLPTEAEWEYAAGGGLKSKDYEFSGSDNANKVAWYVNTSGGDTHPVGTKEPNELGLYDMSGNAWEWVNDWYGALYYKKSPIDNPPGPPNGDYKIIRGGSWCSFGTQNLSVSVRVVAKPEDSGNVAFRFVKDM